MQNSYALQQTNPSVQFLAPLKLTVPQTFAGKRQGKNHPAPPALDKRAKNTVLEEGVLPMNTETLGAYAGQAYQVVILNVKNARAAHKLSEIERHKESKEGKENILERSEMQIRDMMQLDLTPKRERGGLLLGVVSQNKLLAMGGVALVADPADCGRGKQFTQDELKKYVFLKMAVTHPDFQKKDSNSKGSGLTQLLFPHRINLATKFADRDFVVTMVANKDTQKFYGDKMGFASLGDAKTLSNVKSEDNKMMTFAKTIKSLTKWIRQQPNIVGHDYGLQSLNAHIVNAPTLVPIPA